MKLTFRNVIHKCSALIVFAWLFVAGIAAADEPLATIEGNLSPELSELLAATLGEAENPPRSLAQARRRVERAAKSAEDVMRSQGYYGAAIEGTIVETIEDDTAIAPPKPVLTIVPGPRFKFSNFLVKYANDVPDVSELAAKEIELSKDEPALAARVVAAELRIVNFLNANGYPDARAEPRKAVVDHDTNTMSVTYNISAGRKTRFGEIVQTGTAYLAKGWPSMVAPFETGEVFDIRDMNVLSARVIGTGVFDSAVATLDDEALENPDGTVTRNVHLNIDQTTINTVSGEIGYSTTDGSGVELTYERRNFIGYAQTLTLSSALKTNQISFGVGYNIPYALRVDREIDLGAIVSTEDTDALNGEKITGNVLLTQKISKPLKLAAGFGVEASQFEQSGQDIRAYVIEGLGRATYDTRNNILDPETGWLLDTSIAPSYNFGEDDGAFGTFTLTGQAYRRISEKLVAAARVKGGTIVTTDFDSIPLNRRFYAGGGGSVRGFEYQSISPTDPFGDLIGGRSILEGTAELRYRGESALGFAGFLDGASVNRGITPDFDDVRFGAGIGVRYYTNFAPLRADIAIPLNKRDGDSAFQVYISIGQAF